MTALSVSLMASCGGGNDAATVATSTVPSNTSTAATTAVTTLSSTTVVTTPTPSTSTGENLETILGRGQQGMSNVQLDFVGNIEGETITAHIWMKQNMVKMRMAVDDEIMVMDGNNNTAVMYFEASKRGLSIPYDTGDIPLDEADNILEYDPKIVGHETIDGMPCVIVEYTTMDGGIKAEAKTWIWIQHGFPVKIEVVTDGQLSTILYSNISLGTVADNDFVVPPDVTFIW